MEVHLNFLLNGPPSTLDEELKENKKYVDGTWLMFVGQIWECIKLINMAWGKQHSAEETTITYSDSQVAGVPNLPSNISQQSVDTGDITDGFCYNVAAPYSTNLENMVVDSGDLVIDGVLVGFSSMPI